MDCFEKAAEQEGQTSEGWKKSKGEVKGRNPPLSYVDSSQLAACSRGGMLSMRIQTNCSSFWAAAFPASKTSL